MLQRALLSVKRRPYLLFLFIALALIVYPFFTLHQTTDIHIYDTMLVIPTSHICWLVSFCFIAAAGLYAGLKHFLPSRALTWAHILLTLLILFLVVFFADYYNTGARQKTYYYINTSEVAYRWLILFLLGAQLIFAGHLFWGIARYIIKKR
ncbi:hypothetical protein [Chitinophaga polysaccharea]|uniref:hypothetical protein n=1 Tax=Chitinophaga polysaccharea TaxID=1293035 RepID=UPI001159F3CA|nr:hypothetical protein [Chitinophaga polysaccharea]